MTVDVANDIPEPNDVGYLPALQQLLIDVHRAQQGSPCSRCSLNRREMEKCFEVVQPALKGDDLRVVCQKWGVSVKGLRDDCLADEHLSLFALKQLREGFERSPAQRSKASSFRNCPSPSPPTRFRASAPSETTRRGAATCCPPPCWKRNRLQGASIPARPTTRACSS